MSAHTPGPWCFGPYGPSSKGRFEVLAHGRSVAVVEPVPVPDLVALDLDTDALWAAESADARLIASAPDLLAALKAVVGPEACQMPATVYSQILAAIARAERMARREGGA